MQLFTKKGIDAQSREALVSLTGLTFIEDNALLARDQLTEARNSLQALFLRTSGEETMLRKLIEILKTTRALHQSFANIGNILSGVSKGIHTLHAKIAVLREQTARMALSAEENADFVGPFLSFSQRFVRKIESFQRLINDYLEVKEAEARQASHYRIARDARVQLKQRLAGSLGSEIRGEIENKIRREVIASFDYSEAETNYKYAQRDSLNKEMEVREALAEIRAMCQMAMNPAMRANLADEVDDDAEDMLAARRYEFDDIFTLFASALRKHPRMLHIKDAVLELFKLYQRAFGMLSLDFTQLAKATETMIANSEAYFDAKEEDRDIRSKRDKLHKIEGLIPFLEHAAALLGDRALDTHAKFSKRLSEVISAKRSAWEHIVEDLLRAKVQAEAELSTRL